MGGDLDRARAHIDRGLQLVRILGNTVAIAMSLHNLGNIALAQQDVAARGYYEEALQLTWSAGDQRGIAYNVAGLAAVALREGDPARAARLASAADTLMRKTTGIWEPDERPRYDQTVQEARRLLDEPPFAAAWAAGETLTIDQLIAAAQAREER